MQINFHYADVKPLRWKVSLWKNWLKSIAANEGYKIAEINYIFCSDEYLLQVNRERLQHDYYTDIITFDLSDEPGILESDIYISTERVTDHAQKYSISFESELARVTAHGILHLCGYKDKTKAEITEMRAKEDFYLETAPVG